ncbi:tRNA (guanine(26)-N(2))-dimethyltransferase, partial [Dictyocoela roeselum]
NPSQQLNRTLSTLFLKTIPQNFTLLECMSATGLRSIQYLQHLDARITLNDKSKMAYDEIIENLKMNNIGCVQMKDQIEIKSCGYNREDKGDKHSILDNNTCNNTDNNSYNNADNNSYGTFANKSPLLTAHPPTLYNVDCNILMLAKKFNIIDIDPFGSPTKYLHAAFNSVTHKGILCITATDTAVLCNNRNKCFLKYSVLTRKTQNYEQMAIRVLLGSICQEAARNGCYVEPLLCVSIDFYVRVFVRVYKRLCNQVSYYKMCYCLKYCDKICINGNNIHNESINAQNKSINDDQDKSINDDQNKSINDDQNKSMIDDQNKSIIDDQNKSINDQNKSISDDQNKSISDDQNKSISDDQNKSINDDQDKSINDDQNKSINDDQNKSI